MSTERKGDASKCCEKGRQKMSLSIVWVPSALFVISWQGGNRVIVQA